ncbi:Polynucleotidyl transferase, ribonuclease H-like superfamily protein [Quillaja saponaria]|uniref:Polynucleotidyl transferase, ribonuclease H-like superfamily protein n=1 Tax=Quillaja saponaria TaxID=32244 RepID=A0AAD7PEV8_QUISA|nr:Polynucleotidyl transferase, ribonuclease H-like superfamily protein [Quillaja saponaria]
MRYVKPLSMFHDLLNTTPKRGRLLGLDVGDKYVGDGCFRPSKYNCFTAECTAQEENKFRFNGLRFSESGVKVVVQVKVFIDDLCKTGKLEGLRYTYWNECFTSKGYLDYVNRKMKMEAAL